MVWPLIQRAASDAEGQRRPDQRVRPAAIPHRSVRMEEIRSARASDLPARRLLNGVMAKPGDNALVVMP